jgi:hypothetical protein
MVLKVAPENTCNRTGPVKVQGLVENRTPKQSPLGLPVMSGHTSVPLIQVTSLGYFTHISITTPIVSALKNNYII